MIASSRPEPNDAVRSYRPRIKLPADLPVEIVNRFARPRQPLIATVEGLNLAIGAPRLALDEHPAEEAATDIVFHVARVGDFALRLPIAVVYRVLAKIEPGGLDGVPSDVVPMLAELALSHLLDALERLGCPPIEIKAIRPSAIPAAGTPLLVFEGQLDGYPFLTSLVIDMAQPASVDFLLRLVETAPEQSASLLAIPLRIGVEMGRTRLTMGQLRGMRAGDGLLPDLWYPTRRQVVVRLGDRLAAQASFDGSSATLTTGFQPSMQDQFGAGDHPGIDERPADATVEGGDVPGLDTVGVTVTFELGRRTVEIGELQQIGPGYVFDLGGTGAVDIVANGVRIGQGEIIEVGERLAVRLVHLYGQT